jgi:hypothetical protein
VPAAAERALPNHIHRIFRKNGRAKSRKPIISKAQASRPFQSSVARTQAQLNARRTSSGYLLMTPTTRPVLERFMSSGESHFARARGKRALDSRATLVGAGAGRFFGGARPSARIVPAVPATNCQPGTGSPKRPAPLGSERRRGRADQAGRASYRRIRVLPRG